MILNSYININSIYAEWKMEVWHEGQLLFENSDIIENTFDKVIKYNDTWTFVYCITLKTLPDESDLLIKIKISKWIVTTEIDLLD